MKVEWNFNFLRWDFQEIFMELVEISRNLNQREKIKIRWWFFNKPWRNLTMFSTIPQDIVLWNLFSSNWKKLWKLQKNKKKKSWMNFPHFFRSRCEKIILMEFQINYFIFFQIFFSYNFIKILNKWKE